MGLKRDLSMAVTLLTCLPLRAEAPCPDDPPSQSAAWFPAVGLVLGLGVSAVLVLTHRFFYGISLVGAVLVVCALAAVTRMLHWDGLADVADAWFVTPERRLSVMADSAVGAFGATAIVLVSLLEVGVLVDLGATRATAATAVIAIVASRLSPSFAAWFGVPARPGGLGASVMGRPSPSTVVVASLTLVIAALASWQLGAAPLPLAISLVLGVVLALVTPHLIAARMGGVTGDVMGASVQVVEVTALLGISAVYAVLRLAGVSA